MGRKRLQQFEKIARGIHVLLLIVRLGRLQDGPDQRRILVLGLDGQAVPARLATWVLGAPDRLPTIDYGAWFHRLMEPAEAAERIGKGFVFTDPEVKCRSRVRCG